MTGVISAMRNINQISRYLFTLFMLLNFVGIVFAGTGGIQTGLSSVCNISRNVLAIGVMVMVILAAIVYALGQVMGAETRARATVWATAMMTGALIGILIYILVPLIIQGISGSAAGGNDPCAFTLTA